MNFILWKNFCFNTFEIQSVRFDKWYEHDDDGKMAAIFLFRNQPKPVVIYCNAEEYGQVSTYLTGWRGK